MRNEFTIIGGGIAGLSAAIALRRLGITAKVYEAAPVIRPVGAGLVLAANAMKAYAYLGVAPAVEPAGRPLDSFTIYDHRGRVISRLDNTRLMQKHGVNNFTIHRAALHHALLGQLEPPQCETGKRAVSMAPYSDGVRVDFADGTTCDTRYLLVADGVHSALRRQLLPGSEVRYAGYTCWRGLADNTMLNLAETSETWGPRGRFGIAPLSGGQVYWFACCNAPRNDPAMQAMTLEGLAHQFSGYHDPVQSLLAHTSPEQFIWNDIIDLQPINQYAFGNILLLGDAAHATTPNMGQGACQAIEDAAVLLSVLRRRTTVEEAFRAFEQRRLARTHAVVKQSWRLGKMAQWTNPVAIALRNALFRAIPDRLSEQGVEKIYTVDF